MSDRDGRYADRYVDGLGWIGVAEVP